MRNMEKQKEKGRQVMEKHPNADLIVGEMMYLKECFKKTATTRGINEAIYDLICNTFYSGVAVGYRTGKKDSRK